MTTEPPSADRIIPARAGFTSHRPRQGRGDQDHPRSRGVYWRLACAQPGADGSSPLARCLRIVLLWNRRGVGIIPARAGFTAAHPVLPLLRADHPRSRGVYPIQISPGRHRTGSSPLARGLRGSPGAVPGSTGIIPARAGFTVLIHGLPTGSKDHPRSRGVYDGICECCSRDLGSSPLARGLLPYDTRDDEIARIIPARAGFTGRQRLAGLAHRDHPRSRGVYAESALVVVSRAGSSPLARGLLGDGFAEVVEPGIIPARAGFTTPGRGPRTGAPDHPRSRGVYRAPASRARCSAGSSPLARGLRGVLPAQAPAGRIIPARAGFTLLRRTPAPPAPDHPRSRGVYPSTPSRSSASTGSSPLARGLPDAEACNPSARRDHPRSRGVYPSLRDSRNDPSGSSPLARGLREQHRHHGQDRGIIPARAGFTAGADAGGAGVEDHPRSRGVYGSLFFSNLTWSGLSPLARGLL